MDYQLEVIGFTIDACLKAQEAGAHRIELCDNPGEGGTTPSYGFIQQARQKISVELYPIIRPRGGDFLYNDIEFEIMKADVLTCKQLGCDGIVTGILNADGSIDKERNSILAALAYPMGASFHRAFDRVNDAGKALEDIIACGFERILTSGLAPTAEAGAATIAGLVQQADHRISIMPGSGVRAANLQTLINITVATEFHTSARTNVPSEMQYNNPAMDEALETVSVNVEEIKQMLQILQNY